MDAERKGFNHEGHEGIARIEIPSVGPAALRGKDLGMRSLLRNVDKIPSVPPSFIQTQGSAGRIRLTV
jgi:hypothetical protein